MKYDALLDEANAEGISIKERPFKTYDGRIKGKDISLNLDMENGFIWKINGTSITAETPADTDLSV